MNRNLLPQISSLFTHFITKSYTLVLTLVFVLNFGITSKINAQCIGPYQGFESFKVKGQAAGGFVALTGSTAVASIKTDDAISGAIPIGFTFTYNGNNYTNVYASSNGFLSFNPAATSSPTNNLTSPGSSQLPLLAPLWDDLDGTTPTAVASYLTTGVAGSRIFTFEWLNWEWGAAANTPVISFQVKLYEANGRVEFIYRPDAGAVNTTSGGASVGVTGNVAGDFLSLASLSTTVVSSRVVETSNITAKPAAASTFGIVGTMVGDGWGFTATAVVASNVTNARTGTQFVQLSAASQSITTPLLINADKFQFWYRAASATSTAFTVESSADPTFLTGVTSTLFTATSTTYSSTGLINIPTPNSYVRIVRAATGVALFIDDLSWTSTTNLALNNIIVPELGNSTCNPVNVPAAGTGTYSFYDQGGLSDTYNKSQTQIVHFAPSVPGEKVKITFNSFAIDAFGGTNITVYNGNGTTGGTEFTGLNAATAVTAGTSVTSTDASGYITVKYVTTALPGTLSATTHPGFNTTVECVSNPTITSLTGSGCAGGNLVIAGTNLGGATEVTVGGVAATIVANTATSLTVTPAPGSSGTVAVTTAAGSVTSTATYAANLLPTISSQPSSSTETLCVGGSATPLSVTAAAGSGTISTYQWYSNTSASTTGATLVATNSSAATTDTYTPSTASLGTLYYYVVVTNSNTCSVTSTFTGAITVNAPVSITASPSTAAQTVCVGSAITPLSVTATGGGLGYQWYSNNTNSNVGGTLISGATAASYTPSNASAMAITYYYCLVSNGAPCNSSVTSNVSGGITVNALPAAVIVSASGTYCTNTTLTAANGGSGTIYFQSTISGGTFTAAPTASQVISLSGTYYFRARSAAPALCWGPEGSATVTILSVPVAPVAAAATAVGTSGFTANWANASGATGYSIDVSTVNTFASFVAGYNNLTLGNVLTTAVTGLTPGVTYFYRVRAFNSCGASVDSNSITVTTNPVTYCIPTGTSQDPNGITNVTLGTINNPTGLEAGSYGNYSNLSTNVFIGATVPFSITYGTGFTYNTYIWVDWNNDGDFTDLDERVYVGVSTNAVPTTLSGTFTVPLLNSNSVSTLGSHRLRIGGVDFDDPSDPCRNGSWQAYEDYTINVISVPPCAVSTPSALTTANVTATGATLVWSDPAMTPNTVYNYWVSNTSTPPAATCANPVGMGTVTGALSANVTGLTLGVQYYFWVRVKCDATTCGPWIGSATFTTANLDVVNMINSSITTCNARFYDSGGFAGSYNNNEDFTYTFIPASGTNLKVVFNSFSLEQNFDFLSIYDGPSTASPLLGTFTGTQILAGQTFFSSTANGGRLTFRFTSDFSVTPSGWDASISCVSVPIITSFTPTFTCAGSTLPVVTINGSNFTGATSVSFNGVVVPITPANITGSGTIITVTLPALATSGLISVSNSQATGSSSTPFTIRPIPATPTASADVAICNGQSTNLTATIPPFNNALATTQVGGNSCGGGNMFNIVTGINPIIINSFDITPEITGAQSVNVYYRVGTYLTNETNVGSWILLGTYAINGPGRVPLNMPVDPLNLLPSTTYGIYINYNASYTNGNNTYSNTDLTINTGAGLCSLFGGVTASRTFNGVVRYQVNGTPTYTWTPSTGLSSASIANPSASPTGTTTYSVTNTFNGCTSLPDSVVVTVNPIPTTTITTPASNVCANSVIAVNVTGSASTYTWTSSPANILYSNSTGSTLYVPGTNTPIIYVKTSSTATITATGSNALGCSSTSTVTFTVSTRNWNGAIWTNPSGPPLLNDGTENLVFLAGTFNSTGNLSACSCTVNGANVTFNPGHTLSLLNGLTVSSGSMTFNNDASLVQTNNVANTGNIIYKRNTTPVNKFDYTYWSTPVSPQTLFNLSPLTPLHYQYDASIPQWVGVGAATTMVPGKGYISRAPSTWPTASTAVYNASFIGVPNNGTYTTPVFGGSDQRNLLGNPYPSAIDATLFVQDGTNSGLIDATLYFWTHNTPINASFQYIGSDYAVWNILGGIGTFASTNPGVNPSIPNGFISAGQGFFVKGLANGNVTFKNTMRVGGNNNQFFRLSNPVASTENPIEKNRFWLDIFNSEGAYKQMLMGYVTGGTIGLDRPFDGEMVDVGNVITLYTMVANKKLSIQGRGLPFVVTDTIPLGYKSTINGIFTIALSDFDGLFETQNIYLEDTVTGEIHDLKNSSYTFSTESGTFEGRFVLRFTIGALGVPIFTENTVVVYKNEMGLSINSGSIPMKSVAIYDVTGRLITSQKELYATQTRFTTLPLTNQVLLVQITSETGVKVTKKVVF